MAIKEMEYKLQFTKAEVLARDSHKGYEYAIISYGVHPCAYVAISEGQPYFRASSYEDVDLSMHGGCTFVDRGFDGIFDYDKKVIGWDYAHCGDFSGTYLKCNSFRDSKKWTTQEIMEECENVIEQLYVIEHPELYYK